MSENERYFLGQDSSCHWYLVPDSRREEWNAWRNLDEEDEASWTTPGYAERLEHHPCLLTFENPRRREKPKGKLP